MRITWLRRKHRRALYMSAISKIEQYRQFWDEELNSAVIYDVF
jgi:hypothetical protein